MAPRSLILTHGGVGAPLATRDGPERAAAVARAVLTSGGSAIRAAVAGVEALEADGRFCAGHGSSIRLDGRTVEMDAAIQTSAGDFAAVAAIAGVPNPILVVERLVDTPACFLAGEGARRFAERHGLAGTITPTARARARFAHVAGQAVRGRLDETYAAWAGFDLEENWNFPGPVPDYAAAAADAARDEGAAADTVGAVVFDASGSNEPDTRRPRFVAAVSTGGTSVMLMGRVGDSPLPGCGLYAGPEGAVTVTGVGEEITRRMLSRWIYDRIVAGVEPFLACREGVELFPERIQVGAIAVTATSHGHAASHEMPVGVERM